MFPSLCLAASLAFAPADATRACERATEFCKAHAVREAGTIRGMRAAYWILDTAAGMGLDARLDRFRAATPKGERGFVNVTSEFENNPTAPWIVLVSHFDTKPGVPGPFANDGASTTGLLLALGGMLERSAPLNNNVMLIWTDAEECQGANYTEGDGLQGSKRAAAELKRRGAAIRAVLCLDMLGDADLAISVPANGDPRLSRIAVLAAKRAGLEGLVTVSDIVVKDDHVPFLDAGFPAIDLIDFEYGSAKGLNDYWHTAEDTPAHISADSLQKSGELVTEILRVLDRR